MTQYVYIGMFQAPFSVLNLVYSQATRKIALDFNFLRFLPRLLYDARDACQAALRAREGSQGCVGSSREPAGEATNALVNKAKFSGDIVPSGRIARCALAYSHVGTIF